jgi:AbrB family looped-hinge helix DNA binding protein
MPVTVKGQVTVPKPIRDRLGLAAGSRVSFVVEPDGRVTLRRADAETPPASRFARARQAAKGRNSLTTAETMKLTGGEDWGDAG